METVGTLELIGNEPSRQKTPGIADHSSWITDAYAWNVQVPVEFLAVRVQRGGFVTLDELTCKRLCAAPDSR